jgi:hypothetical protein
MIEMRFTAFVAETHSSAYNCVDKVRFQPELQSKRAIRCIDACYRCSFRLLTAGMSAAPIVKKPASSSTVLVHPVWQRTLPVLHGCTRTRVLTLVSLQLVLLNIVDHGIRSSSLTSSASAAATVDTSVCGIMFGVQAGLNVEVFTSVEMIVKNTELGPIIDEKFVNDQRDLSTLHMQSSNPTRCIPWY